MPESRLGDPFRRAQEHAFHSLSWSERQSANLYLGRTAVGRGERLGPPFQETVADEPAILVFADLEPRSGFGHPCRYLLYHPESGDFQRGLEAQFPPFTPEKDRLTPFHLPVPLSRVDLFHIRPALRCPPLIPDGERYAILFSGYGFPQNLNDLEFSYRMLVDHYGFHPQNVYVHHYDGTLATALGAAGVWPGDGTPFRLQVTGPGTRAALQQSLNTLNGRLGTDDLVFLHTENEATLLPESALVEPDFNTYRASALAADIAGLPKHESLIALMASCYATGFSAGLLASSPAESTSVSCASAGNTAVTSPGWDFMKFACDWLSAQAGHDPFGAPTAFDPDTDRDGVIEAEEAFAYAHAQRSQPDTPSFSESSEEGGDIALGQRYEWWWWWCWLLLPLLEPYYLRLPEEEFYSTLRGVLPELKKILPAVNRAGGSLRRQLQPEVKSILAAGLGETPE
jgi:hypothetical protein